MSLRLSIVVFLWCFFFLYLSLVPFYYLQPLQITTAIPPLSFFKYLPFFIIIILSFFLLFTIHDLKRKFSALPINWYVVAYLLVSFISLFEAKYPLIGGAKLVYYSMTGIVILYLIIYQFNSIDRIYTFVRFSTFVVSLVALYGIVVYLFQQDYIWGETYQAFNPYYSGLNRVASTIGNAVFCAAYLALWLPFVLWLYFRDSQKFIYLISIFLIVWCLTITFARGGWISAAVATMIYMWPKIRFLTRRLKTYHAVVIIIGLLMVLPIMRYMGSILPLQTTMEIYAQRMDYTSNLLQKEQFRIAQYSTAWGIIQTAPLFGLGFGNFTSLFEQIKAPSTPTEGYIATTTENMYLMVISETGILGFTAFCMLFGVIARTLLNAYIKLPDSPERDFLLASFAAFIGFMVNMLTWDALNQPTIRMTFWIVIGLSFCLICLVSRREGDGNGEKPKRCI